MKVIEEYPNSHHYVREYIRKETYYCPSCGKNELWVDAGGGDFYLGAIYLCTNCRRSCNLDSLHVAHSPNQQGIIDQLISGIAKEPTTQKADRK